MKRRSVIGIIIIELLMGAGSVFAETSPDHEVIPIPEFPPVALLIAFFIGMIGAALFIRGTTKNEAGNI